MIDRVSNTIRAAQGLPPEPSLSHSERDHAMRMVELAQTRIDRILILLVSLDGHPIDLAARLVGMECRAASERIKSLDSQARSIEQIEENEQRIRREAKRKYAKSYRRKASNG